MKCEIAEVIVEFEPRYKMLKTRAEKYKVAEETKRDFKIIVYDEHIQKEMRDNPGFSEELAEYMLVGNTFYRGLLNYQGCLLHASAVVVEDEAYFFSANCGTGKSTHTSLWLNYLADKKPYILNDDKPAIRILEDGIYAYGTPFSGKHDISRNTKVKLKAICFIEQSKDNWIRKLDSKDAIKLFFEQTFRNLEKDEMLKFFDILEEILKQIPIYQLGCDMSEEAVQLSYRTMKGERTNEN